LTRVQPSQLALAFADSPTRGKGAPPSSALEGRAYLLHIARARKTQGSTAGATDTSRLLKEVTSPSNMAAAMLQVASNQGAAGVDGVSVKQVVAKASKLLPKLRRCLLDGTYQPGDIRRVWIPKPGRGRRGLGIPNVVDRWVQQAVHQVLMPIFEPTFHPSSHGFRPDRGAKTAIAEAKGHITAGYDQVVNIDLSKFFDRVHHQRLLSRLGRRVKDGALLRLVRRMLKAKVVLPEGTRVSLEEGTPQGGPLSPLLSNIVLDELDQELQRRGLRFVRYADDANVYVRSERAARRVMVSVTRFIECRLRLKVNQDKSTVARSEDVHFLGFRLRKHEDGEVEVLLSDRTVKRIRRRIQELTPRNATGALEVRMQVANTYLRGWLGYFRLCTKEGARVFADFDAHLRRRFRAMVVKRFKRARHLYRHLIKRGAPRRASAANAWSSRGVWHRSRRPGIERAYPNSWFHERMVSLSREWQRWEAAPAQLSFAGFGIPT